MSSAAEQEAGQRGRADGGRSARPAAVLNGSRRPVPAVPVWPGTPTPLGARFHAGPDGAVGTNFAPPHRAGAAVTVPARSVLLLRVAD